MPSVVFLLTGEKAAGKDTLAKYLVDRHGFAEIRIRDLVFEEAQSRGIAQPTIKDLQDVGDAIRREAHNNGAWITRVLARAGERGIDKLVINGIRNPAEITTAQALAASTVLLGVVASESVRWERVRQRIVDGRTMTREEFVAMDRRDHGEGQPPEGQRVADCLALVSPEHLFRNEGEVEAFFGWADHLIQSSLRGATGDEATP